MLVIATHVRAEQYVLAGRSIELPSPQGYCKIGETAGEKEFIELTAKGTGPSSRILGVFLKCEEVAKWRKYASSESVSASDWVVSAVMLDRDGQLRPMEGASRSEFVRLLGGAVSKDPSIFSRTAAEAQATLNNLVSGADFKMVGAQVLKADNDALYFIIGTEVRADNGENRRLIGISANTLIKGVRIVYANYRQVRHPQDGNALFGNTSAMVHAAVQANP
ncbi:hypothetical protein ACSFA8_26700 [Variovorax sp. RT4R15]|uniref:hypothetical protein n=1 Tax=Variovorax sp. RT4R15 TaxID=3443737 RepID=UPI003F47806D